VTRSLLDTDVVANAVRPEPSPGLLEWVGVQRDEDLFIASLTVAETRPAILDCVVVSGNEPDFVGLEIVNPMREPS
jgi:hypothetical protein